ncbi:MAG: hydantoinase B/oxoprolinase family protein [Betaproteobacteria bacterium]|nr:hydantoinase B/oxoprolinase family protein [Betaproteobacteria bacterium]
MRPRSSRRASHPAAQVHRGRRGQSHARPDPPLQHPDVGHVHGRPQCAARRLHGRSAPPGRAQQSVRRRATRRHLHATARSLRADDARGAAQAAAGTFHYVDCLDNDGVELDKRVRLEVAVTIDNGTIHFGLHRHRSAGARAVQHGAFRQPRAAAYYAVRALTDAQIPTNGGCFRPVTRCTCPRGRSSIPSRPPQ